MGKDIVKELLEELKAEQAASTSYTNCHSARIWQHKNYIRQFR